MIHIKMLKSKNDLKSFIDFPHSLYADDKNYIPELFIAQQDLLTKHPFLEQNSVQYFLAYRGENVVGRIAAILNENHNQYNQRKDGFFGFFECINDIYVAKLLFNSVKDWLKGKNATTMVGPVNFSFNESCGLLIDGYDTPPVIMTPYNPSYYRIMLEDMGFEKKIDLFAYRFENNNYNDKSVRLLGPLKGRLEKNGVLFRRIDTDSFDDEVDKLREVYNRAWDKNTGFVPMTEKEFHHMAKGLKMILDRDFCIIAEKEGRIIGFALAIPDFNQVFKKISRGRLFPTGLFKILLNRRKISGIRILLLGVVEEYRKKGIEACLYGTIIANYQQKGLKYAEASWTLEKNSLINNAITAINGRVYKKFRIFEKEIR